MTPGDTLTIKYQIDGVERHYHLQGTLAGKQLLAFMDGKTPISRIVKKVKKSVPGAKTSEINKELSAIFELFNSMDWLYLRRASL